MHEDPDQELQSSRIPDSAPGVWREGKALRECVLIRYPESHARMLREILSALSTIYGEEGAEPDFNYCGSYTKGQLRAAMQDLRYAARFLAMVARMGLDEAAESDQELAWFADQLAVDVEALADRIAKRIVPVRKRRPGEDAA